MSSTAVADESFESFSAEVAGIGEAITMVTIHGEVDVATVPELEACLLRVVEHPPERLVLDVSDLSFLDCAGARVLARTRRHLGPGCTVVLRRPVPLVRKVLALTNIDGPYVIEDSSTQPPLPDSHR